MYVSRKIIFILLIGCALLAQSAVAATVVAAKDASATSKATAQYVCDGSNDQVELNSALAGGGEVVMTEGTFYTSGTIIVKGNSIFRGQGPDKTVLNMAGDYAARVDIASPTVTVSGFKITNRGWLMITTSHVKVHDVTIQDSKKTAPTVNGMFFVWASGRVCEDIEFIRCKAIDVGSTGFNLNGEKSPRVNRNIRFEDCLALRCGNPGSGKIWAVGFDFHEGADLYDLYVNNCRAEDCWESGFYFEPNFYNGEDPNTALPVQVNSRVSNCISIGNGWRNDLDTRFYMTGYYLSCGVTLTNCFSQNNRNNGFWLWQGSKDVILNSCMDDGSDKAFQVRTGSNLRFNNCISKNARTYALYAWGSDGAVFTNFQIYNPKKTSGAVCLGLREDHPNDPWPVTDCTFDIKLYGADTNTLIRYYNANNNDITINGINVPPPGNPEIPELPTGTGSTPTPTPTPVDPPTEEELPPGVGHGVVPGTIQCEDFDAGGENVAYHDVEASNFGGAYRMSEGVDIEYSDLAGSHVIGWTRPAEWLRYTVNVTTTGTYNVAFRVASPNSGTSFKLSVDGTDAATVSVPNTGSWDTFTEVVKPVTLTAGKRVLKISTNGYHNLDSMRFYTGPTPPGAPVASFSASPTSGVAPLAVQFTDASTGTSITARSWTFGDGGTSSVQNPSHTFTAAGTYTVTLTVTNAGGSASTTRTVTVTPTQAGPGAAIPGLIEAENFNTGGEGVAYHDVESANLGEAYRTSEGVDIEMATSEGSYVVGWVRPGEWLKYSVNVAEAGVYDVSFRISCPRTDGSFKMQVDGTDVCTVMAPNTGSYSSYQTVVQQVSLPAGSHVIRLYFNGYTNVNWIKFLKSPDGPRENVTTPQPPTGQGVPLPVVIPVIYGNGVIPGAIQAEDFNTGGQGVGYYDTTSSNFGGVYRTAEDVDIELSASGDSPVVCWVRPGEWLKYTANIRHTGDYDVVFRVSSQTTNTQMRLQVDGVTATTFTVPNTGSFDSYTNVTQRIRLTSGAHVLRLVLGGYQNIDYMAFTLASGLPAARSLDAVTDLNTTIPVPGVTPVGTATAAVTVTTTDVTASPTPTQSATGTATATTTTPVTTVDATATATPTSAEIPTVNATTAVPTVTTAEATTTATLVQSASSLKSAGSGGTPAASPTPAATATEPATVTATETATPTPTPTATPTPEVTPAQDLMQVAAMDRNLSTFVSVVGEAGLAQTLNGLGPYTVFAPTDEAFEALPPGVLDALRANRTALASVLEHHVAKELIMSANMTGMHEITVLQGEPVAVTVGIDGGLRLDDATVNRTDVSASNGVIHVVDAVLLDPDAVPTPTTAVPTTIAATTVAPPDIPDATTVARTSNGTPVAG